MLYLNLFPISIHTRKFRISRVSYLNEDQLRDLRRKHNETHSFFRRGDYIYISPMLEEELNIGKKAKLAVQENTDVVSSLIRHIFFRTFRAAFTDILPQDFYPFRFFSRREEDDILSDILPKQLNKVLARKRQIEIQFREYNQEGEVHFGAVITLSHRWIFNKNCKYLLNEGFEIKGRSVLHSQIIPGLKGILSPDESLIGVVQSHNGQQAFIDSNEGIVQYPLNELFLQKSKENIFDYLSSKIGEYETEKIFRHIAQKDETRLNAVYYFNQLRDVGATLSQINFENTDGFSFSIDHSPLIVENSFNIEDPVFIFDFNPGYTHTNKSKGLVEYGPYDARTFELKHPRILVVCHKSNRDAFSNFAGTLEKGMPSSYYFKGGMAGKYKLHDIAFDFIELDNYSGQEYLSKIKEHIKKKGADTYHLAIVETLERFKQCYPADNPYYQVRAYFLSVLRIPVQFIKNEHLRKKDKDLQWICDSVALQMYAKLRGTPWVLPASTNYDHEIVVGIGSIMLRRNLFIGSTQERIVGITTFFKGDGRYILSNRCREVPYSEYFDELLESLRESIQQISAQWGWKDGNVIRIVFHVFKPIKNVEAEVVEKLISEFTQYEIRYCFVTISTHHPFLLFDTSNTNGHYGKGRYVPERGTNWKLDEHACLLQMKGARNIKSTKHGFSNPVLIRIHEKSTYNDLNSIVQQVYNFTHLSWRGFFPTFQPVTILYSNLIARHLTNLKKIDSWNPEVLSSDLKFSKWFL